MTWQARAACRAEDPELFFPLGHGNGYTRQIAVAKAVCRDCPVRIICVVENADQPHGIFGGHTEQERAAAIKANQPRDVDQTAVDRYAAGDHTLTLTRAEMVAVARQLLAAGHSRTHVEKITGRAALRQAA